jgi:phage shock protein C
MTSAALPTPSPSDSTTTGTTTTGTATTGTPSTRQPTLRRSATDRMVGGVAGGLAEHLGIDALLWRIGFVALTLAGGSGVLVYLLLWVLMPPAAGQAPETVSPVERLVVRLHDALHGSALVRGRR